MKLLTKEIIRKLPKLYANEEKEPADIKVIVKFFCPWSNWTWFATEYDPEEGMFYGLVTGHEKELGYFTLAQLESIRGPAGIRIERDLYFGDHTLKEVMDGIVG